MKIQYLFLLFALCFNPAWADFSNTSASVHPLYVGTNEPYIIDVKGEWPTDCHPGEQKPVISEYTGDTALIEFETILEHVTCNDVVTPFRVLIDMSDVVGSVEGEFAFTEITIRYGEAEFKTETPQRWLALTTPPPLPPDIKPDAGVYYSDGLEKQSLVIARQNVRMGAVPHTYDETGSSEWLLGPGEIVEDVFFAELLEYTGGQCLGCPEPEEPPQMNVVGKISMLMDSEGVIQVKVNDGLFKTYEPSEYGYGHYVIYDLDDNTAYNIPNLSGRWAFADDNSDWPGVTTPRPTSILPLVFDIALRSTVNPPPPVITPPPSVPPFSVFYAILNIERDIVAEMDCRFSDRMICELRTPAFGTYDESYEVEMLSIERMIMKNAHPQDGVKTGTGTAVRID